MSDDPILRWLQIGESKWIRAYRDCWRNFGPTVGVPPLPDPYPFEEFIAVAEAREVVANRDALMRECAEREAMLDVML